MNHVKQLAGQTVVYGTGIVLPRVLNYLLLTPFYTRIFSTAEYGVITELYAYVVFLMVILTYGLETGLFRFADSKHNKDDVYKTTLTSIVITSFIFITVILLLASKLAGIVGYPGHVNYIVLLALIVGLDALSAIPFAKIRLDNRPVKYTIIRIVEVTVNLAANWLFLYWGRKHYLDN
ncbi:MAG TPA: oligosaccharide flippase family protein, partial [Bacteroidales bacterium]|nr:oligosaccharide flippase family protein [Bacteroidales bacterium]